MTETDCQLILDRTLPNGLFIYICPKCKAPTLPERESDPRRIARRCGAIPYNYPSAAGPTEPELFTTGDRFKELAQSLGFTACGFCEDTRQKMNRRGPNWCAEHRDELIAEVRANIQRIADGTASQVKNLDKALKAPADEKVAQETTHKRGLLATMGAKAAMVLTGTGHAIVNSVQGKWIPNPLAPGGVIGSMIDEAIKRSSQSGGT